jgi:hypothetical protein
MWVPPDNHVNRLVLAPKYSKWLWRSSWVHFVTVICAYVMGAYDLSVLASMVLVTSLNYWRNPDYGYRRYVDIVCVQVGIWWACVRTLDAAEPSRTMSFMCTSCMTLLFVLSVRLHRKNQHHSSTVLHMLVHFTGNLGICVAVFGQLPDFRNASIFRIYLF